MATKKTLLPTTKSSLTVRAVVMLIRGYQKTLSPDHSWVSRFFPGGFCRFTPSCSQYTIEAIEKYGLIKGMAKGLWRILRCNPFNKGGHEKP